MTKCLDTLNTKSTLQIAGKTYNYYSLPKAEDAGVGEISKLPYTIKVLIENLLRHENGKSVTINDMIFEK